MLEVPSFYEEMKNNAAYKETQIQQNTHKIDSSNVFFFKNKNFKKLFLIKFIFLFFY
jgi:hypothetical protein